MKKKHFFNIMLQIVVTIKKKTKILKNHIDKKQKTNLFSEKCGFIIIILKFDMKSSNVPIYTEDKISMVQKSPS